MKRLLVPIALVIALAVFLLWTLFPSNDRHVVIPVKFIGSLQQPALEIEIEGCKYLMELDTGLSYPMAFQTQALEKITGKVLKTNVDSFDLRGDQYEHSVFAIPPLRLAQLTIDGVLANEEHPQYLEHGSNITLFLQDLDRTLNQQNLHLFSQTSIDEKMLHLDGRIGLSFFRPLACLFDFVQSKVILGQSLEDLGERLITNYTSTLWTSKDQLVVSVETDRGQQRFLLDTGTSVSLLNQTSLDKASSLFKTQKLVMGDQDYGSWEFLVYPFGDRYRHLDGILGLDFFKNHPICLDFAHQRVWIQKESL